MSPIQEAYMLMQHQPESNIQLIVNLLRAMPVKVDSTLTVPRSFKRTGIAKGKLELPDDFDEHFDDLNEEIAESFYGGSI